MTPRAVVIRPKGVWDRGDWADLWEHRELLGFLVWRDLKVRYRQTLLGAAWAVLQPVAFMAVFSLALGRLGGIPSEGIPYPLFALCALVPWTFFSNTLSSASMSLVDHRAVLTKVRFPRILLPAASVLSGLLDLLLGLCVLAAVLAHYGFPPARVLLALPLLLPVAAASALAPALWLSALNARYRDVRYAVPFALQLALFATPVLYPASLLPAAWRPWCALNPAAALVEAFRRTLLDLPPAFSLLSASGVLLAILLLGVLYFRSAERDLADVV